MTNLELQQIFESPYSYENWRKVIDFVFPEVNFLKTPMELPLDNAVRKENAKSIKDFGNTILEDGERLVLYEIEVKETVRLDRNVKAVRKLISNEVFTGFQIGLAIFHSPDKTKWRFSLVIRELSDGYQLVDKKPTSFTYVFGTGEKGRTAADRFIGLAKKHHKTLKELEDAFSVKALSDKFFVEYKAVYEQFVNDIVSKPGSLTKFKEEEREKQARDFVKKTMGRIIFLYFLQRKGWMGCKTKWTEGNEAFVKCLFDSAGNGDHFYWQYLEPLFFETLNEPRIKTNEDCIIAGKNFGKVPFLNGGLFEKDEKHPEMLLISWEVFNHLFETLEAYNFTIHEDDPDFKEVAVDPEMLGHIFENLLEDNKDKGAFYTPKEIVHYMCQESLTQYLKTTLEQKNLWPEDNEATLKLEAELQKFVKQKSASGIIDLDRSLATALKEVKICDPAIGSGAFPMGILIEIFQCVNALHNASPDVVGNIWDIGEEWNPGEVKLSIIQNSIYGVDLEKGAVDIARLRFWLSLVVDEEKPRELPNLDYKIVVGDSLLSKFEKEVIEIDWGIKEGTQTNLFGNENLLRKQALLNQITAKQKDYFQSKNKVKLAAEIRKLKLDILINQLELMVKTNGLDKRPTESGKKAAAQMELWLITQSWKNTIDRLEKLKQNEDEPFEHFDWKLDFPEVLNPYLVNGNAGFDIVIGNPPYLNFKMYSTEDKKVYRHLYSEIFDGKADIYYYFFFKSHELSKSRGVTSLITSRYWIEAEYAKKLRKFVASKTTLKEIIDFKNVTIFDGIGIKTCISTFLNIPDYLTHFHYRFHPGKKIGYINLREYVSNIIPAVNITTKDSWNLTNEASTDILNLIENGTISLDEIAYCKQGIVTGLDKAFITTENEFKNLPKKIVKPWLKVGDIQKYSIELVEKRELVYTKLINSIDDYPQLKQRFLAFKSKLSNRREAKNGKIRWFDLQWPREQELFDSEKLICRFKASENTFCYDIDGFYSSADTTVVALNSVGKKEYETKYLLALLNSKLLSFYFKSYGKLMDYRYEYYPGPVGRLRIKPSTKQKLFSVIVDFILFLKVQDLTLPSDQLMPTYFEQIIDGMVYELYFPELIKKHKREIIQHLGEMPEFTDNMSDVQKMKICKTVFNRLNEREHLVRVNLFYMNSIPEIAIIEGKNENY